MKKSIIVSSVIMFVASVALAQDAPLKVLITTDKKVYSVGDEIKLTYTIQNISNAPMIFFPKPYGIKTHAVYLDGNELERKIALPHSSCSTAQYFDPSNHIKLAPKQTTAPQEHKSGAIIFNLNTEKFEISLNDDCDYVYLQKMENSIIRISVKINTYNPNGLNLTKDDCTQDERGKMKWAYKFGEFPHPFYNGSQINLLCDNYDEWTQNLFFGSIESAPVEIGLNLNEQK